MNEPFGWLWIHFGVLSGLLLGTGFLRPHFLGGYASPRRRLLRLGHISFIGLGALNILFAHSMPESASQLVSAAALSFIAAGISMPIVCAAVAWRQSLVPLFVVPVSTALFATAVIAWEMLT